MAIPVDSKNVRAVELYCWLPVARRLDVWPFAVVYAVWLALLVTRLRLDFVEMAIVTGALVSLNILTALFTVWSVDFRCFAHARQVGLWGCGDVGWGCVAMWHVACGMWHVGTPLVPQRLTALFTVWSVDFRCFAHARQVGMRAEKHLLGAGGAAAAAAAAAGAASLKKVDKDKGGETDKGEKSKSDKQEPDGERKDGERKAEREEKKAKSREEHKQRQEGGADEGEEEEEVRMCYRRQQFVFDEGEREFKKLRFPSKETFGTYVQWKGFEFPAPTFLALFKEQCSEPFFVFQVFCVALWCMDEYWYYSIFTLFMLLVFESTVVASRLRTLSELRRVRVDTQGILVHREGNELCVRGGKQGIVMHREVPRARPDLVPGDIVSIGRSAAAHTAGGAAGGKGRAGGAAGAAAAVEDRTVPADLLLLAGTVIANEAILTGESTPQWKGLEDPHRSRYKLFLNCSLIITSVIPPELPMELSIAVNTSLIALVRHGIYCTEPFRIPFAGKVCVCVCACVRACVCSILRFSGALSIAVNTPLITLVRQGIYCTEPFQIPFAGEVRACVGACTSMF
ncbi:unnamed protein product [Closterium sp. NIES-54]